ncbi:DUF1642 domain-containing protein [Streptococcus danieliae]|uniref:DUF1642 domain-containing protein n=1 Tax=Streptococcus danieliae TaxID=747656 RepID=UPI0021C6EB84|nr:DUF1642 domain-containing protein [Streptococcus danieliae]MCU0083156.1 DUF1642 domain-containing protein [Streptococcus danieliae]
MSELKYKEGDKFLVEVEITDVDIPSAIHPYRIMVELDESNFWVAQEELDKLQKVDKLQVPQRVVDFIKANFLSSNTFMDFIEAVQAYIVPDYIEDYLFNCESREQKERQKALAILFADGIEAVEVIKEKKYKVSLKANGQKLIRYSDKDTWFQFESDSIVPEPYYTKSELDKAGFGGVFDNPMFEVEVIDG